MEFTETFLHSNIRRNIWPLSHNKSLSHIWESDIQKPSILIHFLFNNIGVTELGLTVSSLNFHGLLGPLRGWLHWEWRIYQSYILLYACHQRLNHVPFINTSKSQYHKTTKVYFFLMLLVYCKSVMGRGGTVPNQPPKN